MRSMLAHAYAWRVNQLEAEIPLTRYVDNWGRAGDVAVVATEGGNRVGAAWFRVFRDRAGLRVRRRADAGVDDRDRAVPARHGLGPGAARRAARAGARARAIAVSLSVEADSPAVGFYERNGFGATGDAARRPRHEARALGGLRAISPASHSRTAVRNCRVERVGERVLAVEQLGACREDVSRARAAELDRDHRVVACRGRARPAASGARCRAPSPRPRG